MSEKNMQGRGRGRKTMERRGRSGVEGKEVLEEVKRGRK